MSKVIIKTVNTATGKESSKDKAFNELNWGVATQNYLTSVKALREKTFVKIVSKAQEYAKLSRRGGDSQSCGMGDTDERATLIEISDDEGKAYSTSIIFTITQIMFHRVTGRCLRLRCGLLPSYTPSCPLPPYARQ